MYPILNRFFRTLILLAIAFPSFTPAQSGSRTRKSLASPAAPYVMTTERISLASDGTQGNGISWVPSLSADGRLVAFESVASDLVADDTNGKYDVFVRDLQTGLTERVSVATDGTQGNGNSGYSSISADGRFVAFYSDASNLIPGDINNLTDVFVHDRQTGLTERIAIASNGAQGNIFPWVPSLSADGRFVAFMSFDENLVTGDTNASGDVFVRDIQTGMTERVSVASGGTQGNDNSYNPSLSADGRFVAFSSSASNLVAGDTNGTEDIFVHDRQTGATERVSVASDGTQGNGVSKSPSLSANGRFVAFRSIASNLVVGDTNGTDDIFVHDRQTGATERVSVASDGSQGNGDSYVPSVSADGRLVAFESLASNLVAEDINATSDVFVHDRQTGVTERFSVASDLTQGNGGSYDPSFSADGRFVAFDSQASNLIARDTNGASDVFLHGDRGVIPSSSISGQVTSGGGGLADVSVLAGGNYSATTDSSGNYTISGLPAGAYHLTLSKSGYTFATPALQSVPPSRVGVNIIATLITYSISGEVLVSGSGLAGVTISAGSERSTITNSSGNYTLSGFLPGSYILTPSKTGYGFEPPFSSVTITSTDVSRQDFVVTQVPKLLVFLPGLRR